MPAETTIAQLLSGDGTGIAVLNSPTAPVSWDAIDEAAMAIVGAAVAQGADALIVDLASVPALVAEHLAFLLRCWRHAHAGGCRVALCNLSAEDAELLQMTALTCQFSVYDDRESALQALAAEGVGAAGG